MASSVDSLLVLDMALALSRVPVLASALCAGANRTRHCCWSGLCGASTYVHPGRRHYGGWLRKPRKVGAIYDKPRGEEHGRELRDRARQGAQGRGLFLVVFRGFKTLQHLFRATEATETETPTRAQTQHRARLAVRKKTLVEGSKDSSCPGNAWRGAVHGIPGLRDGILVRTVPLLYHLFSNR